MFSIHALSEQSSCVWRRAEYNTLFYENSQDFQSPQGALNRNRQNKSSQTNTQWNMYCQAGCMSNVPGFKYFQALVHVPKPVDLQLVLSYSKEGSASAGVHMCLARHTSPLTLPLSYFSNVTNPFFLWNGWTQRGHLHMVSACVSMLAGTICIQFMRQQAYASSQASFYKKS